MSGPNADLLVELGCEELPPKALANLAQNFFEHTCTGLETAGIVFDRGTSRCLYTPRRMTLLLSGVAARQPDRQLDRRGPAVSAAFDPQGKPTPAALGFARSVGMEVADLQTLSTDAGEWLHCKVDQPGQALTELLFPILQGALARLPVPKPMRWSDHDFSFVRPVHWLLVLHGEQVLAGELFGCAADRLTRGHRIHAPGPHPVARPEEYLHTLRQAFVEGDPDLRRDHKRRFHL
jgi:glycyl-tRNA synthetase beta chain